MSNTVYGIIAKTIKAKLNGESVPVNLSTFVCMANDLTDPFIGGDFNQTAKTRTRYLQREQSYKRIKEKPQMYVTQVGDYSLKGSVVYHVPANFSGLYDEYDAEKHEPVGTLMGEPRHWYIETNLEVIEQARRDLELEKYRKNKGLIQMAGCKTAAEYEAHLKEQDQKAGQMVTRRHGLFFL